ncbi:MAG: DegT/DnrJ/EryC1/StrS family aminotransferase [Gemmatimonadota bacterium]|nr:DegT/DnrJ/EryC1/StrS family aminotransferase [Gemmatimonadota bacterium]
MKVPFLNLSAQHAPHRGELDRAIAAVIDSNAFAGGPFVAEFEKQFASFCGTSHAIGVSNGTDALWLALLACGIGAGDEVITVPSTFMATAEAITYSGATPVFVDVDEETYTMDPRQLEGALTSRTKAVIPVHLFGQMADMDPIIEFARKHRLKVIEDAAQAHGAEYKGRCAGSIGEAGCFSFYPGKNLGAFGEAGAVVTNDAGIRDRIRVLRDHGQARKYHHTAIGWNCRMDGIQGAVLSVKLRQLERGNQSRRAHAEHYERLLREVDEITTPQVQPYAKHVFHIYSVRVQRRDEVIRVFEENGIGYGVHYPIPVHLQEAYASLGYGEGSFPVAERVAQEFLSLPMYPELTSEQVAVVAETLKECVLGGVPA